MRTTVSYSVLLVVALAASGCALALPGYNSPFSEKVVVMAADPPVFVIAIEDSRHDPVPVPSDGRLVLEFPVLPRECSTYLFGFRIKDRSVEARDIVHIIRDGRVVKKLSVKQIRRRPVDELGFHIVRIR